MITFSRTIAVTGTILAALALVACDGANEQAGEKADRAAGVPANTVGPQEARGVALDRAADAREYSADASEDQADRVRDQADDRADRLEDEAKRLREEADTRGDALENRADMQRGR